MQQPGYKVYLTWWQRLFLHNWQQIYIFVESPGGVDTTDTSAVYSYTKGDIYILKMIYTNNRDGYFGSSSSVSEWNIVFFCAQYKTHPNLMEAASCSGWYKYVIVCYVSEVEAGWRGRIIAFMLVSFKPWEDQQPTPGRFTAYWSCDSFHCSAPCWIRTWRIQLQSKPRDLLVCDVKVPLNVQSKVKN